MARFRLFDPVPQWRDALGALIGTGGKLKFYDTGTTTPRVVYNAPTGGTSLGAELTIDADGRLSEDFYLDGEYRVILTTAADVTVWQRDNVQDVASGGLEIPDAADGSDGQALFTDGTAGGFYWDDVPLIPSQTGNAGKYLTTDGEALSFATLATYDADTLPGSFTQTNSASGGFKFGNIRVQWGADTAPNTGTLHSTKAVTFGVAFSGSPYFIAVSPADGSSTGEGAGASAQYESPNTTGFTASFFVGAEDNGGVAEFNATLPFTWFAIGPA
jgi:hypothetical protein